MVAWLEGVERIPNARSEGGTYLDGVPWRFTAHTTEAVPKSLDSARLMAERHEYPPHLWAWPEKDWVAQTVRLDRSAFALLHPKGTPETNKMRAIQVEIIGRAADTPTWPVEWWEWIGRRVLRPIIDAGYPINLTQIAPTTGTDGYGTGGAVRMTRDAWRNFGGVCGHANVPDNHHWDIGAGRLDLIAAAASEEDDMYGDLDRIRDQLLESKIDELMRFLRPPDAPIPEGWHSGAEALLTTNDRVLRLHQSLTVEAIAAALAKRLPPGTDPDLIAAEIVDEIAGRLAP